MYVCNFKGFWFKVISFLFFNSFNDVFGMVVRLYFINKGEFMIYYILKCIFFFLGFSF